MEENILESKIEKPVQLVSVNTNTSTFELNKDALNELVDPIPSDIPVAVISVVGAFRSGKSLILDFFLRFLRYYELNFDTIAPSSLDEVPKWIYTQGDLLEGDSKDVESKSKGFSWRCGKERETLGIWAWNKAFILRDPHDQTSQIAVIVLDTQGMFDGETNQMLTTCIFGLTTLISSYQIYNVDKRLQEDCLQHLALFSEYGRVVLNSDSDEMELLHNHSSITNSYIKKTSVVEDTIDSDMKSDDNNNDNNNNNKEEEDAAKEEEDDNNNNNNNDDDDEEEEEDPQIIALHSQLREKVTTHSSPFQRIEFLIRDWQNYSDEQNISICFQESEQYVTDFLAPRTEQDLIATRTQIQRCFETISCFCLPHPGIAITKATFNGELSKFDPAFLALVGHYIEKIFFNTILPKRINDHTVMPNEFKDYLSTYTSIFVEGYKFPKALTLLSATAEVNNRSAISHALDSYKSEMQKCVNNEIGYISDEVLYDQHIERYANAVKIFHAQANIGDIDSIENAYHELSKLIEDEYIRFKEENKLRDPLRFLDSYLIPLLVFLVAFIIKTFIYYTCFSFSSSCRTVYDFTGLLTYAAVIFIFEASFKTMKPIYVRIINFVKAMFMDMKSESKRSTNKKQRKQKQH